MMCIKLSEERRMKVVVVKSRMNGCLREEVELKLRGVCGFDGVVMGYLCANILFKDRKIRKALQILEESGIETERVVEV